MRHCASRLALAMALGAVGYLLIYRPLQLRWGATHDELMRAMPGDDIQRQPIFNATRAITISARPEVIWPWLMQMGYRRGGWYGYDRIDNDGIPSTVKVLPEWQHLKVGDTVPIWRNLDFPVVALEANRYLVFASPNKHDSMALGLYPVDASNTRLVWRIHLGAYNWASRWIFAELFTDLADFVAVRQNLRGIKARAEGRRPARERTVYAELLLWVPCFVVFLASEIVLLVRKGLLRPLLAAAGTGLMTAWLVLVQPPLWMTVIGTLTSVALLWWAFRADSQPVADKEPQPHTA
jgi:hypothetical protein